MSLRLHAVSGTTEIDLIPTPSHITYMIFVDHQGKNLCLRDDWNPEG